MSQWDGIYERLAADGILELRHQQQEGTAWLEDFLPLLGKAEGPSLDLGCGVGSDMLRYAELGWTPTGVDLSHRALEQGQRLGLSAQRGDLRKPLTFQNSQFALVSGRCSLHFFPRHEATNIFSEIHRVLRPGGRLLFIVNSDQHRKLGLQYDYAGAVELEPSYWYLPSIDRKYLFYTTELAEEMLGEGWDILHLDERSFQQWGIEKRVVACVAERSA
jgi:SAM-dependent methyltransferase